MRRREGKKENKKKSKKGRKRNKKKGGEKQASVKYLYHEGSERRLEETA